MNQTGRLTKKWFLAQFLLPLRRVLGFEGSCVRLPKTSSVKGTNGNSDSEKWDSEREWKEGKEKGKGRKK